MTFQKLRAAFLAIALISLAGTFVAAAADAHILAFRILLAIGITASLQTTAMFILPCLFVKD